MWNDVKVPLTSSACCLLKPLISPVQSYYTVTHSTCSSNILHLSKKEGTVLPFMHLQLMLLFFYLQDGCNAFHFCAVGGNVAIAQFLAPMMKNQLFDVDNNGYTALHWATQEGQLSMVEYLVKSCGFDLKAKDKVGLLYLFPG